ncbi:MAG TPA: leucyl aminopeptidase [Arcobacter sp.]|nr:leucyl aminopeptidase [Arcobacter sp.]HIP55817.1 leucyl aminopeptidase [Arcobacter sp.]
MKLNLIQENIKTDIEIIIIKDKKITSNKKTLHQLNFTGEDETCALLLEAKKLYIGCENNDEDSIRVAVSVAIRKLNETNFLNISIDAKEDLRAIIEGLELGNYTFDKYKSKKKKTKEKTINIVVSKLNKETINIFQDAINISNSVNLTRNFVNTTPEDFYPNIMAKEAKKIAKENGLECKIYGEDYLASNGMHTMNAVGRASRHESKLIHLTYKPTKKAVKKIVLVGKGLTYDSGGLSLKPADFMVTMKSDKSGGSAVLGIMNTIAKLNLPIEVHGIVGAVENMIGGDAYKPDDVLYAKNGKTIEIRNTDAEGRLVLADCLCYAQDEIKDIDYIFDYATLTGASVVGVGHYTTSIMGNNNHLNYSMVQAALDSGELATSLPFNRYLRKTIKSKIADICNISSTRYGGAITAGMFLDEFISEENKNKWVHCDIAGPAYVEEQWGYNPYGASGAGVRFTIQFMKNLLKEK